MQKPLCTNLGQTSVWDSQTFYKMPPWFPLIMYHAKKGGYYKLLACMYHPYNMQETVKCLQNDLSVRMLTPLIS